MDSIEDRISKLEDLMKTHQHRDFDGSKSLVSSSNTSAIRAYRATSTQTIAGTGAPVKVQLNAETYDVLGEFDSSTNYRFTAQSAGKYLVTAGVELNSLDSTKYMAAHIYKNGSEFSKFYTMVSPVGNDTAISVTDILDLAGNDYIELYVSQNTGGDEFLGFGENINWLAIHKLS